MLDQSIYNSKGVIADQVKVYNHRYELASVFMSPDEYKKFNLDTTTDEEFEKFKEHRKQKMQEIWNFVQNDPTLYDDYKSIFYLYYFEHKFQSEIASLVHLCQPTVSKIIRKIVRKIKENFQEF